METHEVGEWFKLWDDDFVKPCHSNTQSLYKSNSYS